MAIAWWLLGCRSEKRGEAPSQGLAKGTCLLVLKAGRDPKVGAELGLGELCKMKRKEVEATTG